MKLWPQLYVFAAGLVAAFPVRAQTIMWANNTADFGTATNWTPNGVPGSTNLVQFTNVTSIVQPTVGTTGVTVSGVQFASGAGSFALGGTGPLTLAGSLGVDNQSASTSPQTIAVPLVLTASTTTFNNFQGNLTIAGNVTNSTSAGLILGGSAASSTISGIISGGNLTKQGPGTWTLSGANTYTGTTSVTQGTLAIGADSNLGAAPSTATAASLTLNGGTLESTANMTLNSNRGISVGPVTGTLNTDANTTLTYAGIIAGISGGLNKTGSGTLSLSGASTYSGGTNVQAGTLRDSAPNSFSPNSGISVATGANLTVTANETINGLSDYPTGAGGSVSLPNSGTALTVTGGGSTFSGTITGAGGLTVSGGAFLTLAGANNYSGGTIITNNNPGGSYMIPQSALQIGNGGTTGTITGSVTDNGILNFNRPDAITFSGGISGTGSVGQIGAGTLTLAGTNTYSGGTFIGTNTTTGTITDANDNAFSPNSGVFLYGGTLAVTRNETIHGLGDLMVNSATAPGAVSVAANRMLTIAGSGSTFSGAIGGQGALTVGTGVFETLTGANNYSGGTTLASGGNLQIGNGNGGTTGSIVGNVVDNGQLIFYPRGADTLAFGGVISGTGSLTLGQSGDTNSAGTLALGGANTYTGKTVLNSGTLADGVAGAFSPSSEILLLGSGTTLNVNFPETISGLGGSPASSGSMTNLGTGVTLTITNVGLTYVGTITGGPTSSLVLNGGGTQTLGGADTYGGGTTINGGTLIAINPSGSATGTGNVTVGPSGAFQLGNGTANGALTGNVIDNGKLIFNNPSLLAYAGNVTGGGVLIKNGSGQVALSGSSTYSGVTFLNSGTLQIGATNTLPVTTTITIGNGAMLDVANSQTIGGFGPSNFESLVQIDAATLTVAPQNSTQGGTFSGFIQGAGALTINGVSGSSVTLNGYNTYQGNTAVTGGMLFISSSSYGYGSQPVYAGPVGTGTLTVGSAGTFAISPFATGNLTVANPVYLNSGATLGLAKTDYVLTLSGPVVLQNPTSTVNLGSPVVFSGAVSGNGTTGLTISSVPGSGIAPAVFAGSIGANLTSLTANGGAILLDSTAVAGSAATLQATNNGYIGLAVPGQAATVLGHITNKAGFSGVFGFDSVLTSVNAFSDPLDFSAFSANLTIGSISDAVLTGTIKPSAATNIYAFGGGGGALAVQSALGDDTTNHISRSVAVNSTAAAGGGLTLIFQGANSYSGTLAVTNSAVVLDGAMSGAAGPLPAGSTVSLGTNGYLGYTEAFNGFSSFAGLLASNRVTGYTGSSILGLDSHAFISDALAGSRNLPNDVRNVTEPINLGNLGTITFGTMTNLAIEGSVVAPNHGGTLALAAVGGDAVLNMNSKLAAGNVSQVTVGLAPGPLGNGTVRLGGANTFAGGTTLQGGTLLVGRSSPLNAAGTAIASGPLGTGTFTVPANAANADLAMDAESTTDIVLRNLITLTGPLQLGQFVSQGNVTAETVGTSASFGSTQLVFDGAISGPGALTVLSDTTLNGANSFGGGVTLNEGTLTLGNGAALGTGTLTISPSVGGQGAFLGTAAGNLTLSNNVTFLGGSNQPLGLTGNGSLTLAGTVTLNGNLAINPQQYPLIVTGAVGGPGGLVTNGTNAIVLNPPNGTTNTYSGGTTANQGAIVFATANALPGTGSLATESSGYLGIGFVPNPQTNLQNNFINRFNKNQTFGTIGFDTLGGGTPNTFSGNIDLTGFSGSVSLGSATTAILSGAITPQTTSYNFGGGSGTLQVSSVLSDFVNGATSTPRSVQVGSTLFAPLTLQLTGANTFTGGTAVTDSAVVFGSGSLPSGSVALNPDSSGALSYAGLQISGTVPAANSSITTFLGHFGGSTSGYVGFDASNGSAATVSDLNLSGLGSGVGFATTTNLTLSGSLTVAGSVYRLAGFKGGQLTVSGAITAGSVVVGDTNTPATAGVPTTPGAPISTVTLGGANTYTGGTTLYAGALLLGGNQALGTGALTVNAPAFSGFAFPNSLPPTAQLGASVGGLTIPNPLVLNTGLTLVGGNAFTLAGNVTGIGDLTKSGTGTVTLSGVNSGFSGDVYIQQGTLAFGGANAFGTGSLAFGTTAGTASFLASAAINGLAGDNASDVVALGNGVTLTVNQPTDSQYPGTFTGGLGSSLVFAGPTGITGPSHLTLANASAGFAGHTTINAGIVVIAQSNQTFGPATNTVTLNGGKLVADVGTTISNNLVLTSGRLGGNGTFQPPAALNIGNQVVLAPGSGGAGSLLFTTGNPSLTGSLVLTLSSGGTYNWQLANAAAASGGWDTITVNGAVNVAANTASPFDFKILPILPNDANGNPVGLLPLNFDPTTANSWTVLAATSITGFAPSSFLIDTSAFTSGALGTGSFSLSQSGSNLLLNFSPVPEPSTYLLLAGGLGALFLAMRWRRC